jgi:hypothetical protein
MNTANYCHYTTGYDGHLLQINPTVRATSPTRATRHLATVEANANRNVQLTQRHFLDHTASLRLASGDPNILHDPVAAVNHHLATLSAAVPSHAQPSLLTYNVETQPNIGLSGELTSCIMTIARDGTDIHWGALHAINYDHHALYNLHLGSQTEPLPMTFFIDPVQPGNVVARAAAADTIAALGACYLPTTSQTNVDGWLCRLSHLQNTTHLIHRNNMPNHDGHISHASLVPIRQVTFTKATASTKLRDLTTNYNGAFILVTAPHQAHNGRLHGGPTSNADSDSASVDLGFEGQLAPPYSAIQRLQLKTINVDLPPTNVVEQASTIPDSMPSNDFLRLFPIDHEANVDVTTSCLLTKPDGIVVREHSAGCFLRPWLESHPRRPFKFTNIASNSQVTAQLAPVFAGISATWLDRNAVASLTTAANWMGSTRSTEMDPITKAALRSAAAQPIELTALYVRLWALYYSAAIATCKGEVYAPAIDNGTRHIVRNVNSYSDWAAVLGLSHNTKVMPLFFDSMALQYVDDITHPLAIATARNVYGAGSAELLWVPIPGLQLYTNGPGPNVISGALSPWSVMQTIDWLATSTNTQKQMVSAQCLVATLLYRPQGYGPIHASNTLASRVTVGLPACNTRGQYLSPLSLWATTLDPELPDPTTHSNPPDMLRAAAAMSLTYIYTTAAAIRMINTPAWWPKQYRRLNARKSKLMLRVSAAGWYPALLAAHLRKLYSGSGMAHAALNVWPPTSNEVHQLSQAKLAGCLMFLPLSPQPFASDDEAATFAKIKLIDNLENLPLGRPVLVKALTGSDNPQYIIPHATSAGCTTELHLIDNTSSTIVHKVPTSNLDAGYARMPPTLTQNIRTCLTITIPDIHAAFRLKAVLHNLHEGTWYSSGPETFIGSDERGAPATHHDPASSLPPAGLAMAAARPPTPRGDQSPPRPTDHQRSEGTSGDNTSEDLQQIAEASADSPTSPPPHLEAKHIDDPIIKGMIQHAGNGCRPHLAPLLDVLADWKIPNAITTDNESLTWVLDNIALTLNPKYAYSASCDIAPVRQALAEQIKLNTMRSEAAMLQQMFTDDPGSLPPGTTSVERALQQLLPDLPKNGEAAVAPATTAATNEQDQESLTAQATATTLHTPQEQTGLPVPAEDVLHGPALTVATSL